MTENSDGLYLTPVEIRALSGLLREIPDLVDDLVISRTGQAKLGSRNDHRIHRRSGERPLPFNVAAARAADHLHAVLVGWVRLVCEQRALEYRGAPTTAGLALWLDHQLIAFAMTEGVEDAPREIGHAVRSATIIVCPPASSTEWDDGMIERARAGRLNASGIATLAKELGAEYRNLTVRRVQTLRDAGRITPVPGPWAPGWPEMFVVGEVLDQHLAYPARQRRTGSGSA